MSASQASHLVVTVHGIRTYGQWQERLEALVKASAGGEAIQFSNYRFGIFSALSFAIPPLRWWRVRQFRRELMRLCELKGWTRIDLVGHSFGTYLIAWAIAGLPKDSKLSFHTVILSGSVLRSAFPWHEYLGRRILRLINDCGSRDGVLLLSQFFVFFTGMAGRSGFTGSTGESFRNRHSVFGHSGYFVDALRKPTDDYMREHWLPLLASDGPAAAFDLRPPPTPLDIAIETLATHAGIIKLVVYLTPVIALAVVYYNLYSEASQRLREALARSINARILTHKLSEPVPKRHTAQEQALLAMHSLALDGNADAVTYLGESVASANHFIKKLALSSPLAAVSSNGKYVVTWQWEGRLLSTYELAGHELGLLWKANVPLTCGFASQKSALLGPLLAVSNDGLTAAVGVPDWEFAVVRMGRGPTYHLRREGTWHPWMSELHFSWNGAYLHGVWLRPSEMKSAGKAEPVVLKISGETQLLKLALPAEDGWRFPGTTTVSDDGKHAAVLRQEGTVTTLTIHELSKGLAIKTLREIGRDTYGVAFAPGGKDIVLLRKDGSYEVLRDWSAEEPERLVPEMSASPVEVPTRAFFLRRRDAMIVTSRLGTTRATSIGRHVPFATVVRDWKSEWAWRGGEVQARLDYSGGGEEARFNRGAITSLGVQDDGLIVSTHAGGHLIIWEPWFRFGAPKAGVEGIGLLVQVHPDGARALTVVQANDALRIASVQGYDTATPSVSHLFDAPLPRSFTGGAAVSPDLKRLASVAAGEGDTANAITVYDVEKRAAIRTLLAPQPRKVPPLDLPALAVLAFDRSGRYVIAGHDSGHALVWDLSREAAEAATTFELSQHSAVDFRFKFSSRGDLLLALSAHEIQVWRDWHAPHPVRVAQWKVEKDRSFVSASLSPDNSLLAIAVNDDGGEVRVWKNGQRSAWQLVRRLDTPRASDRAGRPEDVVDLAFHGSANVLAIMDRAGVSVFDLDKVDAQPVRLKRPRLPDLAEGRVGFSSDGKYIIAASTFPGDFVLWLWRPEDLIRDACASLVLEELSAAQWQEYIKVLPRAPACPGTRKAAAIARR